MSDEKQRTLEGLVITDREALKEAVREVLREEGILSLARRASDWVRDYKGDAFWLEFRAHVLQLIRRNVAVAFTDLDQDRHFTVIFGIRQRTQWHRALDQHLVPNAPDGRDGAEIVTFAVGRQRFATVKSSLHCAIAKAAEGRRDPRLVRATRAKYGAEAPCDLCVPHVTYSESNDPSNAHAHEARSVPTDEELAILRAASREEK